LWTTAHWISKDFSAVITFQFVNTVLEKLEPYIEEWETALKKVKIVYVYNSSQLQIKNKKIKLEHLAQEALMVSLAQGLVPPVGEVCLKCNANVFSFGEMQINPMDKDVSACSIQSLIFCTDCHLLH
jgi:hypothetical protein